MDLESANNKHTINISEDWNVSVPIPDKWSWDVFGGGIVTIRTPHDVPLWRRILTRIFLGSKWVRL